MKQQVGLSIWTIYNEYLQKIGIYVPTHWGTGMKKQLLNNFLNPDLTMSEPAPKTILVGTVREILAPAYFRDSDWEEPDKLLTGGIIIYYNNQVR